MQLPLNLSSSQMQTKWKSILDPLLANPINGMSILKDVKLINGVTVINHLLQKQQQGWVILDINGAATIFRSQPFNDLTLTLTSNADVIVNLGVF